MIEMWLHKPEFFIFFGPEIFQDIKYFVRSIKEIINYSTNDFSTTSGTFLNFIVSIFKKFTGKNLLIN